MYVTFRERPVPVVGSVCRVALRWTALAAAVTSGSRHALIERARARPVTALEARRGTQTVDTRSRCTFPPMRAHPSREPPSSGPCRSFAPFLYVVGRSDALVDYIATLLSDVCLTTSSLKYAEV